MNKEVVLTSGKFKGCVGSVVKVEAGEEKKSAEGEEGGAVKKTEDKLHLRVQIIPPEPPFGLAICKSVQVRAIANASEEKEVLQVYFSGGSGRNFGLCCLREGPPI